LGEGVDVWGAGVVRRLKFPPRVVPPVLPRGLVELDLVEVDGVELDLVEVDGAELDFDGLDRVRDDEPDDREPDDREPKEPPLERPPLRAAIADSSSQLPDSVARKSGGTRFASSVARVTAKSGRKIFINDGLIG